MAESTLSSGMKPRCTDTHVICLALQEDTSHGLMVECSMPERPAVHADGGGLG